jgi:hypothetical protein
MSGGPLAVYHGGFTRPVHRSARVGAFEEGLLSLRTEWDARLRRRKRDIARE